MIAFIIGLCIGFVIRRDIKRRKAKQNGTFVHTDNRKT